MAESLLFDDMPASLQERFEPAAAAHRHAACRGCGMDAQLTPEELHWLREVDIDAPVKPELPQAVGSRLVELGLVIRLVEGGYQLTTLGRERLSEATTADSDRS